MLHELTQFVIRHWALSSAFVIVFILIIIEEIESQGGHGQLSPAEATQLMNHKKAVVIDLRDEASFKDGHIIGAKNFAASALEKNKDKLDKYRSKPVILVDANGSKAGRVTAQLKKQGFEQVQALKGGMNAWVEANMPTVKKK